MSVVVISSDSPVIQYIYLPDLLTTGIRDATTCSRRFLADRFRYGTDKGEGDVFCHFDLVRFADQIGVYPLERLVPAS